MKRQIIKNRKANAIAFNPIVWAILGLLVLAVALSVLNLIKDNSDKTNADDLINAITVKSDDFVPGDWGEFASNDYKTAYASTMTLKLTIDIMAEPGAYKKLDPNYKESTDKTKEPSVVGKIIKNVAADDSSLKCCRYKPKDLSQTLYYWNQGECNNEGEVSTTFCPTNTKCLEKGYVNIENGPCFKCTEKGCDIDEFELPQDLASEGIASYADFLAWHTEPKFILYFQEFPRGEEKTWQHSDSTWFLVGIGVQATLGIFLPGAGLIKKAAKVTEASTEFVEAVARATKTAEPGEDIFKNNNIVIEAEKKYLNALSKLEEDQLARALYNKDIAKVYGEKIGMGLKQFDNMKYMPNIKPETVAKNIGANEDEFLKLLKDKFLGLKDPITNKEASLEELLLNKNGLLALNSNKMKGQWYIVEDAMLTNKKMFTGGNLDDMYKADELANFLRLTQNEGALFKQFEKFNPNSRFSIMKEKDFAKFQQKVTKAESLISENTDVIFKHLDVNNMESAIMKNKQGIIDLFDGVSLKESTMKLLGAPEGTLKQYFKILGEGGVVCGVSVAAGGALTVGAVTIGAVSGGVGATPLVPAIGYTAIAGAKGCYKLARTSIYPALLLFALIKADMEDHAEKFAYAGENAFALKANDDFNMPSVSEKLDIDSYPVLLKGHNKDADKFRPFYFVSPCNADLSIKKEICSFNLRDYSYYLIKKEESKTSFIPLKYARDSKGVALIDKVGSQNILKDKIKTYYAWDYIDDFQKQEALVRGLNTNLDDSAVEDVTSMVSNWLSDTSDETFIEIVFKEYDDYVYVAEKGASCKDLVEEYSDQYAKLLKVTKVLLRSHKGDIEKARIEPSEKGAYDYIPDSNLVYVAVPYEDNPESFDLSYYKYTSSAVDNYVQIQNFLDDAIKNDCKNKDFIYKVLYEGFSKNNVGEDLIDSKLVLKKALVEILDLSWYDIYARKLSKYDYLLDDYKSTLTFNYYTGNFEPQQFNFIDYMFREAYMRSYFIEESDYVSIKDYFSKDSSYFQDVKETPTPTNFRNTLRLESNCFSVGFKDFNTEGDYANYCYSATSKTVQTVKEVTTWGSVGLGILLLAPSGGTSVMVTTGLVEAVNIYSAWYINYKYEYPSNGISTSTKIPNIDATKDTART